MHQKAFENATAAVLHRMADDRDRLSQPARVVLDEIWESLFDPDLDFERARRQLGERKRAADGGPADRERARKEPPPQFNERANTCL